MIKFRQNWLKQKAKHYCLRSIKKLRERTMWPSGQGFWLQIHRSAFDSRCYHIFWEVVSLERGPLSLVSTIEELLRRKSSGSGLWNRDYGRRDQPRWPLDTLHPQKLALPSSTSCGLRSINLLILFGIRRNCLISGRSLLLCQCTKRAIKLTSNYRGYHCYQLHATFYPVSFSAFIRYWRKNGSTMRQFISYSYT
jgi:hypothetical protein